MKPLFSVRLIDGKHIEHVFRIRDENAARNKYEAAKRPASKVVCGCLEENGNPLRWFNRGEEEIEEEITMEDFQRY